MRVLNLGFSALLAAGAPLAMSAFNSCCPCAYRHVSPNGHAPSRKNKHMRVCKVRRKGGEGRGEEKERGEKSGGSKMHAGKAGAATAPELC
jgi:hypothetical protein